METKSQARAKALAEYGKRPVFLTKNKNICEIRSCVFRDGEYVFTLEVIEGEYEGKVFTLQESAVREGLIEGLPYHAPLIIDNRKRGAKECFIEQSLLDLSRLGLNYGLFEHPFHICEERGLYEDSHGMFVPFCAILIVKREELHDKDRDLRVLFSSTENGCIDEWSDNPSLYTPSYE